MAQMGFSYEELCEIKPDIILTSVSGFGQYGPYRERPAFGHSWPSDEWADGPYRQAGRHTARRGDLAGRPLHLAARDGGTLAALHHRDKTGEWPAGRLLP